MSKLDFKEEPLDDIGEDGMIKSLPILDKDGEKSVIAVESNLPSIGKPSVATSTALFDLTNEETDDDSIAKPPTEILADSSSLGNDVSKPKETFVVKTIDIEVETVSDPALVAVQILSTDDQVNNDQSNSKVPVSNWLGRFLKTKRSVVDPNSLAPDIEPSNDTFLKEFADTYNTLNAVSTASKVKTSESISDDSSSSDEDDEDDETESERKRSSVTSQQDLALLSETDVLDLMETNGNKPEAAKQLIVNLFNLPYGADVEQVGTFLNKYKLEFTAIELGGSSDAPTGKKPLPLGAASVTLRVPTGETNDTLIQRIQGQSCGGRPLRVQKAYLAGDTRRRSSGPGGASFGRYFDRDISTKCHTCGEVGHKMQECTKTITTCHLCGGTDHDAGDCPNLLCYRCGRFGHHSRECRSYGGGSRPVACFQCGSTGHPHTQCPQYRYHDPPDDRYSSAVDGGSMICMVCRRTGHALCGGRNVNATDRRQQLSSKASGKGFVDIFCPNCGERGHHNDFLPVHMVVNSHRRSGDHYQRGGGPNEDIAEYLCYAPKCEAFFRFQQLQRDYETLEEDEKDEYYRSIARSQFDMSLFPSLGHPRRKPTKAQKPIERVGHKRFREDDDNDVEGTEREDVAAHKARKTGGNEEIEVIDLVDSEGNGGSEDDEDMYHSSDEEGEEDSEGSEYVGDSDEEDDEQGHRVRKRQRRESYGSNASQQGQSSSSAGRSDDKARNSKRKQVYDGREVHTSNRSSHAHHHKTKLNHKEKRQVKFHDKQAKHEQRRQQQQTHPAVRAATNDVNNPVDRNWNRIRQQQQTQPSAQATSGGARAAQAWQDRLHDGGGRGGGYKGNYHHGGGGRGGGGGGGGGGQKSYHNQHRQQHHHHQRR